MPTLPGRLQASHEPLQAVLQHTPSTHWPLAHWLLAPQVAPGVLRSTHVPLAQYWLLAHCESAVQALGQRGEVPLHTYGAQEGLPALPEGMGLHVPTLPVRLQTSQLLSHAELQHTPSTQWLPRHCSARLQLAPVPRRGTQAPFWQ